MSGKKQVVPARVWTDEENALLREMAPKHLADEIALRLGRTKASVASHMVVLGIKGPTLWTAEQDALILASKGVSLQELARQTGRSVRSVNHRRWQLGAGPGISGKWSAEEDERLRAVAWTMSWEQLAKEFGRSVFAMKAHVSALKIESPRWWSAEEDAVILAAGSNAPMRELMEKLGRGYNSVWNRRRQLGVAPGTKRKWLAREVEKLRAEIERFSVDDIAARLGRTVRGVQRKAEDLGLRAQRRRGRPCGQRASSPQTAKPKKAKVVTVTSTLVRCGCCGLWVVNTASGWGGHRQRTGCNGKERAA